MAFKKLGKPPYLPRAAGKASRTKPAPVGLTNWRSLMSSAIRDHETYRVFHSQAMGFARQAVRGAKLDLKGLRQLESKLAGKKEGVDRQIAGVISQKKIKLRGKQEEQQSQIIEALELHSPRLLKDLKTCFAIQHGLETLKNEME